MSRIKTHTACALVVLALLGAARAQATELNTVRLTSGGSSSVTYTCIIANVGTKTISNVSLSLTDGITPHQDRVTLSAGGSGVISTNGATAAAMYCNVSGKFTKSKLLLTMQLLDAAGVTRVAVEGH